MRNTSTPLTLAQLQQIDPVQFELFVGGIFTAKGYNVQTTPISGDGGVDLFVRRNDEYAIVQCKRFGAGKWVGRPIIQQLYGTLKHHEEIEKVNKAYLVTTGFFSNDARAFAIGKPIVLIEGEQLLAWATQDHVPRTTSALAQPVLAPIGQRTYSGQIISTSNFSREVAQKPNKRKSSGPSVRKLLAAIFLLILSVSFLFSAKTPNKNGSTNQFLSMTAAPATQLETLLESQLKNLNGVKSIDQIRTVKSADGYTVFVNATVTTDYQNVNLARAMSDIVNGSLDGGLVQIIVFLDDSNRVVTYTWSSRDDKWIVSSRNK